jgi:hypothetical protein
MDVLVVIFVVIAALVVIGSGVWVAAVLVALVSPAKAGKADKSPKSEDARDKF